VLPAPAGVRFRSSLARFVPIRYRMPRRGHAPTRPRPGRRVRKEPADGWDGHGHPGCAWRGRVRESACGCGGYRTWPRRSRASRPGGREGSATRVTSDHNSLSAIRFGKGYAAGGFFGREGRRRIGGWRPSARFSRTAFPGREIGRLGPIVSSSRPRIGPPWSPGIPPGRVVGGPSGRRRRVAVLRVSALPGSPREGRRRHDTAAEAARPAVRPEKMQPPRKVPSSAR